VNRAYNFDRKQDCRELGAAVDGLSAAIQSAKASGWDLAVSNLGVVRRLCQ
jgi:hypothetical protein